ncbi:MAG: AAA family ATPase [Planctomycetota bacterium]
MAREPSRPSLFSRTLRECRKLYVSSGELVARSHRSMLGDSGQDYVQLMDDLHRGVVLKTYFTVCEADRQWSKPEQLLAEVLGHHLWGKWLSGESLGRTMRKASDESAKLDWSALVRPFRTVGPLTDRVAEVETVISRLANLVARCDGVLNPEERQALQAIERDVAAALEPTAASLHGETAAEHEELDEDFWSDLELPAPQSDRRVQTQPKKQKAKQPKQAETSVPSEPAVTVEEALDELDGLIGLGGIKHEVRSLTNFLRLQQKRKSAGLPGTDISLHMVFTGNPGTGKTTVARIVGKVFRALGVLEKGHLIETDRSGLVAEYAGQTGPKANKCVDSALDGMLFLDEAYSLVAEGSDDPYGREAAQALLKRAEDDRDRLVVILAGYPTEMQKLLRSNPGLSSRFNRELSFPDYAPLELAQIFGVLCQTNHYELTAAARLKVLLGFDWTYRNRDRHFGNGRAVRNLFEHAVRRMANRLATDADIDQTELVTIEACDIEFASAPATLFKAIEDSKITVRLRCPACERISKAPAEFLGRRVRCNKCEKKFLADWGEITPVGDGGTG